MIKEFVEAFKTLYAGEEKSVAIEDMLGWLTCLATAVLFPVFLALVMEQL